MRLLLYLLVFLPAICYSQPDKKLAAYSPSTTVTDTSTYDIGVWKTFTPEFIDSQTSELLKRLGFKPHENWGERLLFIRNNYETYSFDEVMIIRDNNGVVENKKIFPNRMKGYAYVMRDNVGGWEPAITEMIIYQGNHTRKYILNDPPQHETLVVFFYVLNWDMNNNEEKI